MGREILAEKYNRSHVRIDVLFCLPIKFESTKFLEAFSGLKSGQVIRSLKATC